MRKVLDAPKDVMDKIDDTIIKDKIMNNKGAAVFKYNKSGDLVWSQWFPSENTNGNNESK